MANYTVPVNQLLDIGEVKRRTVAKPENWLNYIQDYQLSEAHIPELIQMATDTELNQAAVESNEVWAPLHAWRALAQLQAKEAILPLMKLFELDDDYVHSELPTVYGLFGTATIDPLIQYLASRDHDLYGRSCAAEALVKIGSQDEAARHICVTAIADQLRQHVRQNPVLNGFLIAYLMDLEAVEAADVIESAFAAGNVDEAVVGDWQDVQAKMGLIPFSELQNRRYEKAHQPIVDFSVAASKSKTQSKQSGFGGGGGDKKRKKKK